MDGTGGICPPREPPATSRPLPVARLEAPQDSRHHTKVVERRLGAVVPSVFHRDGVPIRDLYAGWHAACRRAAVMRHGPLEEVVRPQLLGWVPHDFRRTAVRNLVRAGVPVRVATQLTGHLTRSVFDRYDIVSERDLAEGVAKLAVFHGGRGTIGGQSARAAAEHESTSAATRCGGSV